MNNNIFYEEFLKNYKKGNIDEYPVDITAIHAFGIKIEEMEKFYNPEYSNMHWSDILKKILEERENKN